MATVVHTIMKQGQLGKIQDEFKNEISSLTLDENIIFPIIPDSLTFATHPTITRLELFKKMKDGSLNHDWTWERKAPSIHQDMLVAVVEIGLGGIMLININVTEKKPALYYFKVTVSDSDGETPTDPELRIPKRNHPIIPTGNHQEGCPPK